MRTTILLAVAMIAAAGCASSDGGNNDGGPSPATGGAAGHGSGGATGSCAPAAGLPRGTVTWTGTVPDINGNPWPFAPADVAAVVNVEQGPVSDTGLLELLFTDYPNACGYQRIGSGAVKASSKQFQLDILRGGTSTEPLPPPSGTYRFNSAGGGSYQGPDGSTDPLTYLLTSGFVENDAQCNGSGGTAIGGEFPSNGSVVITAADDTHVAGSFDFQLAFSDLTGTITMVEVKATFDAPICYLPDADTACCAP
jgi:hypothetical protein